MQCCGTAFTKLVLVGRGCGIHVVDINGALWVTHQHQLTERDVVEAEIVTAASRVLVEDGDGGRGVVATVPQFIELEPLIGIVGS